MGGGDEEAKSAWRFYYKGDQVFGQPKAFLTVLLSLASVGSLNAKSAVASKLWRIGAVDALTSPVAYDAALAGLGYDLEVTARGIRVTFFGYNERLPAYVDRVTKALRVFDPANPGAVSGGAASGAASAAAVFERQKELLRREVGSFDSKQPYEHAKYWESVVVEDPHFTREEIVKALDECKLADVAAHSKTLWQGPFKGQALYEGNASPAEAEALFSNLEANFVFAEGGMASWGDRPAKRTRLIPTLQETKEILATDSAEASEAAVGAYPTVARVGYDPSNPNSAVEFVFQFPGASPAFQRQQFGSPAAGTHGAETPAAPAYDAASAAASVASAAAASFLPKFQQRQLEAIVDRGGQASSHATGDNAAPPAAGTAALASASSSSAAASEQFACAEVLAQLLEDEVFSELRTRQQLGYIVFSGLRVIDSVPTLVLIVQSSQYGATLLHERVADFAAKIVSLIESMDEGEVEAVVSGAVEKKLTREKRLQQQFGRHWDEIVSGAEVWDRPAQQAAALRRITKPMVVDFARAFVAPGAPQRRAMAFHVEAPAKAPKGSGGGGEGFLGGRVSSELPKSALEVADPLGFAGALTTIPLQDPELL